MKTILKISGPNATIRVMSKNEYGEFTVKQAGMRMMATYHTDDKDDAFGTAAHMAGFLEPMLHCDSMMKTALKEDREEVAKEFLYLVRHQPLPFSFKWNGVAINFEEDDGEFVVWYGNPDEKEDGVLRADDSLVMADYLISFALAIAGPGTETKGEC